MIVQKRRNSIARNLTISVGAQIVSLLVSFVLNLIVPKYISEYHYSLWHIFLLYIGYVGILHFGLLDGIILRYSQFDYEELDKPKIRSQFKVMFFFLVFSSAISSLFISLFASGDIRIAFFLVVVGIFSKNLFSYTSYLLQITNRIDKYATVVITQRLGYMTFVICLLLLRVENFVWFCLAELFGDFLGFAVGTRYNKGLYFGKSIKRTELLEETKSNISSGILLMVANLTSVLLVGSAKMIVQWRWDELMFGKVSFAFSISNLFLTFVTAISVVLFPSIKRMKQDRLPMLYRDIRGIISPMLFYAMVLYFPSCLILSAWLPAYQSSLAYLGILLPIIIFSSKVSLLTNNYLKAYRKEKLMLIINLATVAVAIMLYIFSAYILNNMTVLLACLVFMIMIRSVVSEVVVMKVIRTSFIADFIVEAVMTIIFIICANFLSFRNGLLVYLLSLGFYTLYNRKNMRNMIAHINKFIKRKVQ